MSNKFNEAVISGRNVLIETSKDAEVALDSFIDFASQSTSEPAILIVAYRQSPREVIEQWEARGREIPKRFVIIDVNDNSPAIQEQNSANTGDVILKIASSNDLIGVDMVARDILSRWAQEESVLLWFDSISSLVESAGITMAFRFLHLFIGRMKNTDTRAYYHMDPSSLSAQDRTEIIHIFDRIKNF